MYVVEISPNFVASAVIGEKESGNKTNKVNLSISARAAATGTASKAWALPRFWVSICSCNKHQVKNNWGRILGLSWLKFAVASLSTTIQCCH